MAKNRRSYRPRRGAPAKVGEALGDMLAGMDDKGRLGLVRLWRAWPEVLGREISRMAHPLAVRGTTLILAGEDPVVVQELSYFAPQILERVNAFLVRAGGQEVFDKVRFEMLDGRIPLDGHGSDPVEVPLPEPKKPRDIGALLEKLPADSPVGRCYRAYVRMFDQSDHDARETARSRRKT